MTDVEIEHKFQKIREAFVNLTNNQVKLNQKIEETQFLIMEYATEAKRIMREFENHKTLHVDLDGQDAYDLHASVDAGADTNSSRAMARTHR